jgi:hypothetical protein
MLVEKEVIGPGTYFYVDEATGAPRKLVVTPELTRYWHDQGNKMLNAGLPVPVPYEHDFSAHPMTPREKLLNNAGQVKEYRLKGDKLWSVVDVTDPDVRKKIGHSIRWTSPWINSFVDGDGKEWKNVISHLALTTRPRVTKQEPFASVAAALSLATEVRLNANEASAGFCLSRAGRVGTLKKSRRQAARYPVAFSLWAGGIKLAADDEDDDDALPDDDMFDDADAAAPPMPPPPSPDLSAPPLTPPPVPAMDPLADASSDVKMEELLCDLLQALGVPMPDESDSAQFKRHLYEAVMSKIKELTGKGMGKQDAAPGDDFQPDQNQPPTQQPNASQPQNPLIQQEQQPMYMSLEQINALPDPLRGVALAMYEETQRLRAKTDGLMQAKLAEARTARKARVEMLGKLSPRAKKDLDAMLSQSGMALSLSDKGEVVDPMAPFLAILEKGIGDVPRLLTMDRTALSVAAHPTDETALTEARSDDIADSLARQMGCAPRTKTG